MSWYIIIPIAMAAVVLIIFLVRRNMKDKEELEEKLNQDYHKPRDPDVNDPNAV